MNKLIKAGVLLFLVTSCANRVPPSGGEKDTTPPKLISAKPPMNQTGFKGREFILEFDELFDLDNISSQLIISPPLAVKPDIKVVKKSMQVMFYEESLKPNTTYTFNFGSAIKDHNEGNVLTNFSYVFSTGDFIDSLALSGIIVDAFTHEPVENISVMLYSTFEDSLPLTVPPQYVDKSKKDGSFLLANLKNGAYKLFALEDQNFNFIYDQPSERIGFLVKAVDIQSNDLPPLEIPIFLEDKAEQYISEIKQTEYGFYTFIFNRPLENFSFKLSGRDESDEPFFYKVWPGADTVQFWFPDYEESFSLEVFDVYDYSDTLELDIAPIFTLEEPPIFGLKTNGKGIMDLGQPLTIEFNHPIVSWNPDQIKLYEDSLALEINPYFSDSVKTQLRIDYTWKEGKKYNLIIGIGALTDMYDQQNDLFESKFGAQEESYYGVINLVLNLPTKDWPYRLEMIDKEGVVLLRRAVYNSEVIYFKRLLPAEYRFRIYEDYNENEKWDPGNYEKGEFAEPVYYFPEELKVRSNWELEQTWNLLSTE